MGTQVRIFDWNGKLVRSLQFDVPCQQICISQDEKRLWAFALLKYICMRKNSNKIVTGILICFIFLTGSCDNDKKKDVQLLNVIPIASTVGNYNILNLSDYAINIKYIPLETNDSVLISPINLKIISEKEKILIVDLANRIQNCYLFDTNGKFCLKIGQYGQGPDDYLNIINISMYENFIYLMDWNKILIYSTAGHLVENINLQSNDIPMEYREASARSIIPLKKDAYIVSVVTGHIAYPTAFLFETVQSKVKTIKDYPASVKLDRLVRGFNSLELGSMYRFNDEVRIYKPINDTIFTVGQNMEMNESFILKLGKYRPTLAFFEAKEGKDIRASFNEFIFPLYIFESSKHIFINFSFGKHAPEPFEDTIRGEQFINPSVFGVFDKYTGELRLMRQPIKGKSGFKNDLDNGPIIFPDYISSDNELVSFIKTEEFMEYYNRINNPSDELKEIYNKIESDDNPIVIISKLR